MSRAWNARRQAAAEQYRREECRHHPGISEP